MAMSFSNSVVRRYFLLSLFATVVPVALVGLLYDRYWLSLMDDLVGERLSVQLTAMAKRLEAFLEVRRYQMETLAQHPAMSATVANTQRPGDEELMRLLQLEADAPDLYGILLFGEDGRLVRVVAGQAASGPPYWPESLFQLNGLAVAQIASYEMLGPAPPDDGHAGWFLMRHGLQSGQDNGNPQGGIALHVRLASLTELMGAPSLAGIVQPVLKTPSGYFSTVGVRVETTGRLVAGPEIVPGWQPMLQVDPSQLLARFEKARRVLLGALLVAATVIVLLFYRLAHRLRARVAQLVEGADALASGRLSHRIDDDGKDEITAVSHAFNTMAESLQTSLANLVRAQRLATMGEFAAGIAHEIRNPLSAIKTTVQALARRETEPKRLQLLQDVETEITRLARVVGDLSDFGKPRTPEPETQSVRVVLRRLQPLLRAELEAHGVHLALQGDSDLQLWIDGDQLIQILLNVLLNAMQAMPGGGAVTVRAARDGAGHALIEVRDNGPGVDDATLAKLTDPFFTTRPKGMGLGLSISKQLAELNGCELRFASAPGEGLTVSLRVPLAPEEETRGDDLGG
jgi:two-component system sensor histidine kinase HydH